jgi:hypothetical protein
MTSRVVPAALVALALSACGGPRLVPILPHAGAPDLGTGAPLAIEARASGAVDPMSISGSSVRYGDVAPALRQAVLGETRRFGAGQTTPNELALAVELIEEQAEYARDRFSVALVVRATLRRRSGNVFVAQTQAVCRESALVTPPQGAPVVYRCMLRLGSTLEGWLEEVAR